MAVLTTDRKVTKRGHLGGLGNGPVKAGILLPHGRPVFIDASDGHRTSTSNSGANRFAGMAHTRADNSGGSNGDADVEYWIQGRFEYEFDAITEQDVGKKVYAGDNDVLSITATSRAYVGTLSEFISATKGEVNVDAQAA